MDTQTSDLFFAIAQIAGIFVGFGALISFTRDREVSSYEIFMLRAVVVAGLFIMIGALLPLGINAYGIGETLLWQISGGCLFVLNLASIYFQFAPGTIRETYGKTARANPMGATFFWLILEGTSQVLLILLILGFYSQFARAFYSSVLIINLFQAAYILSSLVFTPHGSDGPDDSEKDGSVGQ